MSAQQLQEFIAAVSTNPELADRFSKVSTSQEAAQVAALIGFDVTAEEIEAAGTRRDGELSDADLAGVAGGAAPPLTPPPTMPWLDCG